jgi:primosomal protein N' (replication factor Y)
VTALLERSELPAGAELLGPVALPVVARRPAGAEEGDAVSRTLVRVRRDQGLALAAALRRAVGLTSARHDQKPVRVQIDPMHIG